MFGGSAFGAEAFSSTSGDAESTNFTVGAPLQCLETSITGSDLLPPDCDPESDN